MIPSYREMLAWAAGFYEGEGSVIFSPEHRPKNGPGTLQWSLAQNDLEPLLSFRSLFGVGSVITNQRGTSYLQLYTLEKIQYVMAMLWPWLSNRRRTQYELAVKQYQAAEVQYPRERNRR